eukprot:Partr_v1_DN27657_c0_g1_i4_m65039 putative membrane bound O-acyltransferase domain containing
MTLPAETLRLLSGCIATYPLGWLILRFGSRDSRSSVLNGTIALIGLALGHFVYGHAGTLNYIFSFLYSFYLLRVHRNSSSLPFLASGIVMVHLSMCHLYRMFYNPEASVDLSGPMMIIAIKVSSIAWAIRDSNLSPEHVKLLKQSQQQMIVREVPTVWQFAGYFFFFPSFLVGPSLEYREYLNWLEPSDLRVSDTFLPAIGRLCYSSIFAGLYLFCSNRWPIDHLYQMSNASVFYRLWIVNVATFAQRCKFYFIWMLSEGSCCAIGFGRLGDGWGGMSSVDPAKIELANGPSSLLRNWNRKTHDWLKHCVYLRLIQSQNPLLVRHSTLITFITSALWHGFYPGYYFAFAGCSFLVETERRLVAADVFARLDELFGSEVV